MDATEKSLRIELERREWAAALGPDDPRLSPANPAFAELTDEELLGRINSMLSPDSPRETFRRLPEKYRPEVTRGV